MAFSESERHEQYAEHKKCIQNEVYLKIKNVELTIKIIMLYTIDE